MNSFNKYIKQWLSYAVNFIKALFLNNMAKNLEIIALKSQLALLTEQLERKRLKSHNQTKLLENSGY